MLNAPSLYTKLKVSLDSNFPDERKCQAPVVALCLKDATHLGTERAPAVERYAYVGKEGYPTYGVDVACGPDSRHLRVHHH